MERLAGVAEALSDGESPKLFDHVNQTLDSYRRDSGSGENTSND